ncbi:Uncharacterized protein DBV15_04732 [Temnothorax longispinosus]|uniref:28S ribosomal protein S18a, mitochondrial n=1 Tax=Temnothorax longispinosus TaxID=300112 RepID=A0A4V3SCA0_9HYME|nr:Uncharacterized protein DBV15_04732 [Temnothorax longispinosus]
MAALFRFVRQFGKSLIFSESNRNISLSATTRLREIIEKKEDNVLTIEAVKVPQTKENLLVKIDSHACPLCATELDVKHTDVLILSLLPNRFTKRNKTGSMSPENSKRRRFNTYYDEDTIKYKYWR